MSYFLREISLNDIAEINTWRNNREIIKYLGSPFRYINKETDVNWFNGYLSNRNSSIRLAICEEVTKTMIGAAYLLNIDWVNRSAEFSIWIGVVSYQGRGAGFFAIKEMLSHAFKDLNLHRVCLTVASSNKRAIGLYKKAGFIEEGCLRKSIFKDGSYSDMVQMSILSGEFLGS